MTLPKLAEKIKNLPQAPGVYFFYAEDKNLLYIGKATNLRSRVQSYFRGVIPDLIRNPDILKQVQYDTSRIANVVGRSDWIGLMITQVMDLEFQQTDSVLEALILESNLIKKHQPKYNTLEKDDKSFSYFVITKEEFPRVLILRKTDLKKYVIPNLFRNLDGHDEILKQVQDDKKKKAKKLMPEKLQAIFGPYTSKIQMQIALKIIRRIFPFHSLNQKSEKGCLDFELGVCPGPYSDAISPEDYRKNIRGIRMILEGKKKSLVTTLKKDMKGAAKKHEFEKAAGLRNKIFALEHLRDVALMTREFEGEKIQTSNDKFQTNSKFQIPNSETEFSEQLISKQLKPARIEAYDISNIGGQHAVGSMVVFENGKPNKNEYRKFKIKTIVGSNDVASMREVLSRRFNNDWAMPDLVLLDGGIGHVNMAEELLHKQLGLAVEIAGVAKGPTRKKLDIRHASLSIIDNEGQISTILQDQYLLKHIMDEAHRFAIAFHRQRRKKGMLE